MGSKRNSSLGATPTGVEGPRGTGRSNRRRGVAIVIVIMILAAMLAVIAPFVLSMTQTTKVSSSYLENSRAQYMAEAGSKLGRTWAYQFDPMWQMNAAPPFNTPELTTLAMLDMKVDVGMTLAQKEIWKRQAGLVMNGEMVQPQPPAANDPTQGFANPQGAFLDVKITDEQSKFNINTVPCRVLGNLLGSCLATEEITEQTAILAVDDASMFYNDGDPRTVDGYIAVHGVRRPYLSAEGKMIVLGQPFDQGTKFPINSLVYDGRAEMIREMRNQREFQSIYELREIGTRFGSQAVVRPQEFERILPFLTAHSFRPSKWSSGTRLLDRSFSTDSYGLQVEDPRGFDSQTHVAIFDSTAQGEVIIGRPEGYIVLHNNQRFLPQQPLRYRIGLVQSHGFDLQITDANHSLWLRGEIPHPVNINTATYEVLKAMVKGVPSQGGYPNGAIDERMAHQFAVAVHNARQITPVDTYDKLFTLIDDMATANQVGSDYAPILKQALVADRQGMRCAAMPVCFRSYFDYTVESKARMFDPSSNLRGQSGVIETFRVPARYPGLWYVDSQSQWRLQADLSGNGSGWLIGPRYIAYNGLNQGFYANVHPIFRDLQPDYNSVQSDNGQIFGEVEFNLQGQFDWSHLAFEQSAPDIDMMKGKKISGRIQLPAGGGVNQLPAPPVLMSGWFFPTFAPSGSEIFLTGDPDLKIPRDMVRLTAENGLTVYITDSTGEVYATVFDGVRLLPRVWHHISVTATGAQPGQVLVLVDGKPVGQFKWPTQFLRLAANIPDQFDPIGVDPALNNANVPLNGDASFLPDMGTIRIGDEIIEYGAKSGNTLKKCLRGRRFTAAVAHAADEVVTRLGFSVKLEQPYIANLNGRLVGMRVNGADVGLPAARPSASVNKAGPPPTEIDAGDTTIPIFSETPDKLPDFGFAVIDYQQRTVAGVTETRPAELIWYSSRTPTDLNGVQRGLYGSTAGKHWHNCRIFNVFVEATNLNGYLPPAGQKFIVQVDNKVNPDIDVEWIEYSTIYTMNGHSYLAHPPSGGAFGNNLPTFQNWQQGIWDRGVYDTGMAAHVGTEKLILVRAVEKPWLGQAPYTWDPTWSENPLLTPKKPTAVPGMYTDKDGTGNEVYLTEANNPDKLERFWVKRAWYNHPWKDHRWNGALGKNERVYNGRYGGPYLVGLNDNPKYDYPTASSRVIRSPVPEFINSQFVYTGMTFNRLGDMNGYVDELTYGSKHEMIDGTVFTDANFTPLSSSATQIQIQDATANRVPVTGLAMIGDEIIFFDGAQRSQTTDQVLNPFPTLATPNGPPNDLQAKLDNLPQWNGSFRPGAITLSNVQRGLFGTIAADWPAGTRVRVITTVFASSETTSGGSTDISLKSARELPGRGFVASFDQSGQTVEVAGYLSHNDTLLGRSGTLRGRYGSGGLGAGIVYLWQPVRHLDHYMTSLNQVGGSYFPLQHRMEGGLWEGLEIDTVDYDPGVRATHIDAEVLIRFDGQPGWDAAPTNQPGGLYLLNLQSNAKRIQFPNAPVRADQIEVRIMQHYNVGAINTNDWKLSMVVGRVRFLVHSEGQTYRRDKTE